MNKTQVAELVYYKDRIFFFTQHFSDSQHKSITFSWQSLNTLFCFMEIFSSSLDKNQPKPTPPRTGMSVLPELFKASVLRMLG